MLSSLDASKIINKIKDSSILGRHWYDFGKNHFRAKNGKANAAALAYAILDSAGNVVLVSIFSQRIIELPELSPPDWELTACHEDLQCFLNLNYEKVNSAELKDWFDKNYNSTNTNIQSDDSKTHKHRKCLVM